ncbi:MAG TPA: hypothetical protein VFN64_09990 [Burkholderiaceae bacterium]|nr:hypothetical protein [Burkholderiaceae bacterium]
MMIDLVLSTAMINLCFLDDVPAGDDRADRHALPKEKPSTNEVLASPKLAGNFNMAGALMNASGG